MLPTQMRLLLLCVLAATAYGQECACCDGLKPIKVNGLCNVAGYGWPDAHGCVPPLPHFIAPPVILPINTTVPILGSVQPYCCA